MAADEKDSFRIENIQPTLCVRDMSASRKFYIGVLGFREVEWGNDEFTSVGRDRCGVYLCRNGQGSPGTWVWIGFDGDIHSFHEQLKSRNVSVKLPPANFSWAMEMQVEDPDGNVLRFGTDPDESEEFVDKLP